MVGIVLACHSSKLADELINFVDIFKTSNFKLVNGSDEKLDFGTSVESIEKAIKEANEGQGVLILLDLGSSIDNALSVKNKLKGEINIEIADAPLVEGTISAVAGNDEGVTLIQLKLMAEDSKNFRKVK